MSVSSFGLRRLQNLLPCKKINYFYIYEHVSKVDSEYQRWRTGDPAGGYARALLARSGMCANHPESCTCG